MKKIVNAEIRFIKRRFMGINANEKFYNLAALREISFHPQNL